MPHAGIQVLPAGHLQRTSGTRAIRLGLPSIDAPTTWHWKSAGSIPVLLLRQDDAGFVFPSAALSGTTSAPDAFGSLKFTLTTDFAPTPIQFTGYIVDPTHIKLIESDIDGTGAGFGATAGVAIGQGTATGTFTANKSFASKYVFEILGQDLSGLPTSLASVGKFTSDKSGNMTGGFNDEFLAGFGVEISDSFTGSYTLDPSGTGRVDSNINFTNNGPGPEFIFYLTGKGNPPLVLDADVNIGSLGSGLAYPQAASPFSFNGKYGLSFTQNSGGIENDGTGQITVVGASNTLSGVIDTNLGFSPQPNTPLIGSFGIIPNSGRFSGTMANTFSPRLAAPPTLLQWILISSIPGMVSSSKRIRCSPVNCHWDTLLRALQFAQGVSEGWVPNVSRPPFFPGDCC